MGLTTFLFIKLRSSTFALVVYIELHNNYLFSLIPQHTEKLQFEPTADLQALAASCNGYVRADLEALCREVAISAIRKSSDANHGSDKCIVAMDDRTHARSIVGSNITRGVTVEIPKVS
ncbi:hypothetical protein ACH5RR_035949 [Cinchona calisaya]|uniref:AAA ATPase AAA+ lid domain-containing protein n=1 Tax=Cinchona calisaya TaxID=153742 RepID=A0ABD2Y3X3_9GENT